MIKLSDYVMKYISELGVNDIFLLSGGGCMHLVDSVGRNDKLNYICCLHEQVASYAATAYAQYTGNIGVALVTTGPGGTNAITGTAAAWTDSIPLLVISGQVKRNDLAKGSKLRFKGYQELDIVKVVKSITKYAKTILKPEKIKYYLDKAVYKAKNGRPGPVWLDIPLDVQSAMIDETALEGYSPKEKNNIVSNNEIEECIKLINKSKRPVILAGYGIKTSGCVDEFLDWAESVKIPILTTWKSMDIIDDTHPLYFGRPGSIGQRCANFIQQNSDLILTLGARLDYGQIGFHHEFFAREAKKIINDIDKAEFGKFGFEIDLSLNYDTKLVVKELLKNKVNIKTSFDDWLDKCNEWKNKFDIYEGKTDTAGFVSTYHLVDIISELSSKNTIFTPENSGAASEIVMQTHRVKKGQKVITTNGLGAMGTGLPASIGACIASGKKNTICVNGDGGIQHNIQDLETIKRLNLPIKFFILNNKGYGSIRNTQNNYFNGFKVASDTESGVTLPDIESVAKAYKIKYYKISSNDEVYNTVEKILNEDSPVICEVIVNPEEKTLPRVTSKIGKNGKMISKPLEDMWPFLDRDEFKRNMIISPIEEDE